MSKDQEAAREETMSMITTRHTPDVPQRPGKRGQEKRKRISTGTDRLEAVSGSLVRRRRHLCNIALIFRNQTAVYVVQVEASLQRLVALRRTVLTCQKLLTGLTPTQIAVLKPSACLSKLTHLDTRLTEVILSIALFGEVCQTLSQERVSLHMRIRALFPAVVSCCDDLLVQLPALMQKMRELECGMQGEAGEQMKGGQSDEPKRNGQEHTGRSESSTLVPADVVYAGEEAGGGVPGVSTALKPQAPSPKLGGERASFREALTGAHSMARRIGALLKEEEQISARVQREEQGRGDRQKPAQKEEEEQPSFELLRLGDSYSWAIEELISLIRAWEQIEDELREQARLQEIAETRFQLPPTLASGCLVQRHRLACLMGELMRRHLLVEHERETLLRAIAGEAVASVLPNPKRSPLNQ